MNIFKIIVLIGTLVSLAACGDKEGDDSGHDHGSDTASTES